MKSGVGLLLPVEGSMTAETYVRMLTEHVLPWIREKEAALNVRFTFMHDNAPSHSARLTRQFFAENGLNVMSWPPYSPDLNPIENLWAIFKRRIGSCATSLTSLADLVEVAKTVWAEIPQTICANLVNSIPKRIKLIIQSYIEKY